MTAHAFVPRHAADRDACARCGRPRAAHAARAVHEPALSPRARPRCPACGGAFFYEAEDLLVVTSLRPCCLRALYGPPVPARAP